MEEAQCYIRSWGAWDGGEELHTPFICCTSLFERQNKSGGKKTQKMSIVYVVGLVSRDR